MSLLLAIIYLSFIALGLPDSLMGSTWPEVHIRLTVPVENLSYLTLTISVCTIVSSFFSGKLLRALGTPWVTVLSVGLTALSLLGFAVAPNWISFYLCTIPLGLGAGCVDAALNAYVALNFKAHHMSFLHCFWGIGAFMGPLLISFFLGKNGDYRKGYLLMAGIQLVLTLILFFYLPTWLKKAEGEKRESLPGKKLVDASRGSIGWRDLIRFRRVLLCFFAYCAAESLAGIYGSVFLVGRGLSAADAARGTALFYFGITFGRFLSGFLTMRLSSPRMIRLGGGIMLIGLLALIFLPGGASRFGLAVFGLGCAPVYPSIIQLTPEHYGRERAQSMMGIQMGFAYIGSSLLPFCFGQSLRFVSSSAYPFVLLVLSLLMLFFFERRLPSLSGTPEKYVRNDGK